MPDKYSYVLIIYTENCDNIDFLEHLKQNLNFRSLEYKYSMNSFNFFFLENFIFVTKKNINLHKLLTNSLINLYTYLYFFFFNLHTNMTDSQKTDFDIILLKIL